MRPFFAKGPSSWVWSFKANIIAKVVCSIGEM